MEGVMLAEQEALEGKVVELEGSVCERDAALERLSFELDRRDAQVESMVGEMQQLGVQMSEGMRVKG